MKGDGVVRRAFTDYGVSVFYTLVTYCFPFILCYFQVLFVEVGAAGFYE